ncbi:hypothetical protein E2C01_043634 [Portunus trituberculatus]|uniref:Uncharacterized protein n=1 Tax=Portunus trituberculatus TaxID=210409 RepID=A0A5B7FQ00_PORTR|nr:hypothetical protein [Portunus trituberculatus]
MPRVKIKANDSKDPRKQSCLLGILSNNEIYATKLIPLSDGFAVITSTDEDLDQIYQLQTCSELEEYGFFPQIPPELKAKRSIIVFNVKPHIFKNTEEDITHELQQHNSWINLIHNAFKFSNSKTMKITFGEATTALKARDHGVRLFHMSIPKHQIQQEKFYSIQTCFKCYTMEDHNTNSCPQHKEFKICSECVEATHT